MQIKVGIVGYGNLGKGAELAAKAFPDIRLCGVFTRRPPEGLRTQTGVPVYGMNELFSLPDTALDVLLLCSASADLFSLCPRVLEKFCTVDGFDIHAKLPAYFAAADRAAQQNKKTALLAVGWDPGLFSLLRLFGEAFLPDGKTYTFWGRGVSQGHTAAIKQISGVADGKQYTLPKKAALARLKRGETPDWTAYDMHERACYVVAKTGADRAQIKREIENMPAYFKGFDTTVEFITETELKNKHAGFPHGGKVFRIGKTGNGHSHTAEFSLSLSSNPEFTGSVLLACARAVRRLYKKGEFGAKTALDIPPAYYSEKTHDELLSGLL